MSFYQIRLHRLAREEYLTARRRYARHGTAAVALRFRDEVERTLSQVADRGDQAPVYHGDHRWMRLRRFPYLIVFTILDGEILVIAVAHASRRPGYWRHRT